MNGRIPTANLPNLLNPYTRNSDDAYALKSRDKGKTGLDTQSKISQTLEKRVGQLADNVTSLAGDFLQQFAASLLGEKPQNLQFSLDSFQLDSQASFSTASLSAQQGDTSVQAAGMQYTESSHFLGKGTITTSDGRQFEFELEISYGASIEALSASQQQGASPAQAANPAAALADAGEAKAPAQPASQGPSNLTANFPGTAPELLDRLSTEKITLPFRIDASVPVTKPLPLFGNMLARLLNLPDGPRYLDLRAQPKDQKLDTTA